ncbi:unnamed protein product [Meganyctiphanes norvegica]|uniref:Apple domain-containing protein n=1 Tax=Meganyctiphanes norvegica TaxID=48144 RepID=A0AAV2PPU3_MEGNR
MKVSVLHYLGLVLLCVALVRAEESKEWQEYGDHEEEVTISRVREEEQSHAYDWTPEISACIIAHNDKTMNNLSLEDCKAHCQTEAGFDCRSVEYYKTSKSCALSATTSSSSMYRKPCPNGNVVYTEISS